jgi:replicative DNA helicase
MSEKNFGYLGTGFQLSLLKNIVEDKKFAESIVEIIESNYFDNNYFRVIMQHIKEVYAKHTYIPTYDGIKQLILTESTRDQTAKTLTDQVDMIKEQPLVDSQLVQENALNFCKQQVLKKALKEVDSITSEGAFENYHKIEQIIQKALQVGISDDTTKDVFEDILDALRPDSREVIPTGLNGIDNLLKGGLGRGELGVVLAPTGTGKTTLLTKFANTAYNSGFNVVQIFFEDNVNNIRKKHFTIWTNIAPDDQPDVASEVEKLVKDAQNRSTGQLKLVKLPSDSVTISEIKSKIRKMKADGFRIDLLTLDYVDCVSPERSAFGEEWKGEGAIMRQLEAMTAEFDIAIWTATQGNRESIKSEVVTTDQMGGSIKKAQIGHVVMSVGKTLEQKEQNLATLTLLKSRIGRDGVVFNNCLFNNEYLTIDTETQNTLLGFETDKLHQKEEKNKQRIRELMDKKTIKN